MKKLTLSVLLLTGCWDFDGARERCEDAGACRFSDPDGGGEDAGVEPEPDRPGDVCETDAGVFCWELPVTGPFTYEHAAWDGQRLWVSSFSSGMLASWDGKRWSGSYVSEGSVAVATTTGVSFVVASDFVAVDGGARQAAPPGPALPLAAWADAHGRFVASCDERLKLRVYSDTWNGQWTQVPVTFNLETPCTLEAAKMVGASRANLWLITSHELFNFKGGHWAAADAGPAGPLGHGWRDGCERGGEVYAVSGYETAHLQTSTQQFFDNTGADALGCTAAGFTLAKGGGFEQRTELEVPGAPSATTLPFVPRRLISPDGGALFAVGDGFAIREADESEFKTHVEPWLTTVGGMAVSPTGDIYAVGSFGFIAKRTPRGWRRLSSDPELHFSDIAFDLQGVGFIGATPTAFELRGDTLTPSARPYRLTDGGAAPTELVSHLAALSDGTIVAVGPRGSIARLAPGSPSWELLIAPQSATRQTAIDARGDIALALTGSIFAVSSAGPARVVVPDAGLATNLTLRGADDFFVADRAAIHHYVDGGVTDFNVVVNSIIDLAAEESNLWLISDSAVVSRTDDGGWTRWNSRAAGLANTLLPTPNGVFVGGRGIARVRR